MLIRVAQESIVANVGQGDFDSNVLGVIQSWDRSSQRPGDVYLYDDPVRNSFNGDLLDAVGGLVYGRSHIMFVQTAASTSVRCPTPRVAGMSLFWVHDRSGNSNGGDAKTIVRVVGGTSVSCRAVQDGPATQESVDTYFSDESMAGERTFFSSNAWEPCCTDGYTIDQLNGAWRLEVRFSDHAGSNPDVQTLSGLNSWISYSSDGAEVPLSLEVDRRAEFRPLASCEAVAWPSRLVACIHTSNRFSVISAGAGPFAYQWQIRSAQTGAWTNLFDGQVIVDGIVLASVSGTDTPGLEWTDVAGDWSPFTALRCIVTDGCASVASNETTLRFDLDGDADGNFAVNFADITEVLTNFGFSYPLGSINTPGDTDNNLMVNFADITNILTNFGAACP